MLKYNNKEIKIYRYIVLIFEKIKTFIRNQIMRKKK